MPEQSIQNYFVRLLDATWLRPERALFDAHLLFSVNKFLGPDFEGPSLEYGCTDGIPTFIMLDGILSPGFDDYRHVSVEGKSHGEQRGLKSDYFDHFNANAHSESIFERPVRRKFDVGLSWKDSHLKKSKELEVYRELMLVPLGERLSALKGKKFKTIFAPNLFWLEEDLLHATVTELSDLLDTNGRIITIFPDEAQKNSLIYPLCKEIDPTWAEDLDRGIHINLSRHACSYDQWRAYFEEINLDIIRHEYFLPSIVGQIYQVGFRPMFPAFMKAYEKLQNISEESLLEVKKSWIQAALHFFSPFCDEKELESMGHTKVWHTFELKRQKY